MEKLKVEEFRAIRREIDEIYSEFIKYVDNEDAIDALSEEEYKKMEEKLEIAEQEVAKVYERVKGYDLSEIPFEEWDGFIWFFNSYDLEGTGANLDFSKIKTSYYGGISRFKGCNIKNFDFENMGYDDDSFDEEFKQAHPEHFLSKDITDKEVRARYYGKSLEIIDVVTWKMENVPIRRFSYTTREIIEKIGLERAMKIDPILARELGYRLINYLEDDDLTEEIDINDFLISKVEEDMKENIWHMDTYSGIPIIEERLGDYFIDFGEPSERTERLSQNYKSRYLSVGQVIAAYDIFEGKKYAHALHSNSRDGRQITEEQIDKFYKEMNSVIPSLFKLRVNWENSVEGYYSLETEEEKKAFMAETIKGALENTYEEYKGELSLKDVYEFSAFADISEMNLPYKDTLQDIVKAKGREGLNTLEDLSVTDLNPQKLEDAKRIGDMLGSYEFLHYSVGSYVRHYGMDNLLRFNKESGGMLDDFIMRKKESKLYDKIHYDHQGEYKLKEGATYEEFENIFLKMLTEVYDRSDLNYSIYRGPVRDRHPEIYLPENAPEELSVKYYTRMLKLSDLAKNPEWIPYFEKTRIGIALRNKEVKMHETRGYRNIYDYLELDNDYKKEDVLKFIIPYGDFLENLDFAFFKELETGKSWEDMQKYLRDEVFNNIKAGFPYSEELPEDFKEEHSDIFISDRVPVELKEKIYKRQIEIEDLRKEDIWLEELKDKDLTVVLSKVLNSNNMKKIHQKVGNEKFLEYAHKYGEYMTRFSISDYTPVEEVEDLIKVNITENILNGSIPYGPDAPDFLRETHPELFISEDAPELLKLSFYRKYTSEDPQYLNHSGSNYNISPRTLLEHPEWVDFLEGKNLIPGARRDYKVLFEKFTPKQVLEMSEIDIDGIEAILHNNAVEPFERFLNEESKNFAYRELLETEDYAEEQVKEALESEDLSNEEYAKIRDLYNKKIEKFKVEIIKNPGVFMDYPYEKIEEFNFGEYRELKALSHFSESGDCRRYMEENLISHIYAFLGYAEAKKLLQLPEMSKEEVDRLITEQEESFNAVYEKRFKLKGNVKVLDTFFEKLDPILPAGKAKFQIYKSINQRLEEGFEGDISELLEAAFAENNLKFDKDRISLCISNSEAVQVSEKMSFIREEMMQKINDTIPENAADKKIIYDNLMYALKDSLSLHKKIDLEHIETLLKKEFSRLNEDGTTFYSPHVTEHISEMMGIIREFDSNPYIANVLNKDLKGLLKEEKEKIGNGWIRKALTITDNLTKEQLDELQAKLYGESGHSVETIKQIELRDKTEEGRRKAFLLLQENDNPNLITYAKAEKMFNSFTGPYSEKFAEFFIKHKEEILANPKYYTILQKMNDKFDRYISNNENRYRAGKISVEEIERYVSNSKYDGVREGEYELEYAAKLAGLNEKYFSIAQKLFEEMKKRTHQTVPPIDITRGRFRGRILRIDDPLHIMVGDITTCCQAIGPNAGEGSMIHSATEKNGSVFVVEEYDEYGNYVNTVAQSWTWRNGDRICFDNVEIPDTLEDDLKSRGAHEEIFKVYQDAARMLISNDRKAMDKLLEAGKITKEQYDTLIAKDVTMGTGCDDLVRHLPSDIKGKLKRAKIVSPVEAGKGYDGYQKGKAPWIDSAGTQYVVAEMDSEERKELSPKGNSHIGEIPLQYTRTREVISRKGNGIHEDICKSLVEMKQRESDEESLILKTGLAYVNQITDEYDMTDIDKVHLSMNTNEDWFILSIDKDNVIRVVDTSIVEGKGAETQKEYDKKLAKEEFDKAMEQLLLEATDSGKRFECEITDNPKFDIFRKLSGEKVISIGEDGVITLDDREKLKEKIEATRESIEQGIVERNIADSIREDDSDDGR